MRAVLPGLSRQIRRYRRLAIAVAGLCSVLLLAACSVTTAQPTPRSAGPFPKVTYPDGAPRIDSDFHSFVGVDGYLRPQQHQGIDILGSDGQPVIAAADGVVLAATSDRCWGPTVVIDHGRDLTGKPLVALYGHLGRTAVAQGQRVRRGQQIGCLGDNQNAYDCMAGVRHLHFQVGRVFRERPGDAWGYGHFLADGDTSINPHTLWADGVGRITCYRSGRSYPEGTLTYPVPCHDEAP